MPLSAPHPRSLRSPLPPAIWKDNGVDGGHNAVARHQTGATAMETDTETETATGTDTRPPFPSHQPQYPTSLCGRSILISWEHRNVEELVRELGAAGYTYTWPGSGSGLAAKLYAAVNRGTPLPVSGSGLADTLHAL